MKEKQLKKKLADYLITDEINLVQEQIVSLAKEVSDEKELISRITPVIDTILVKKFKNDKEILLSLFAEQISPILTLTAQRHPIRLRKALTGTISEGIAQEIQNNSDKIYYPMI